MAIDNAPIPEPPYDDRTRQIPFSWLNWFSDLVEQFNALLSDFNATQDVKIYWFDYADTATAITPISHTGGATNTYLTNNGLGSNSTSYNPDSNDNVWDASAGEFDFSSLKIGDVVSFRVDCVPDLDTTNQNFYLVMDLAIGSGSEYSISLQHYHFKLATEHHVVTMSEIYIGNAATRDYPAKFRFVSADDADIEVNGWFVKITSV